MDSKLVKKYLVCYGTKNFDESRKTHIATAKKHGIDEIYKYTEKDLYKTDYYKQNKQTLKSKRGAGYCLWNPYFILEILKKLEPGSILLYCDCGVEIIGDLNPLFNLSIENDIALFKVHGYLNKYWTKRDTFVLMGPQNKLYEDSEQVAGGYQLFKVGPKSIDFVKEWLDYCCELQILTDRKSNSVVSEIAGFRQHRHDQSVLSLLAVKYQLPVYRDPAQNGNIFWNMYADTCPYHQLFYLHRKRKIDLRTKREINIRNCYLLIKRPLIGKIF